MSLQKVGKDCNDILSDSYLLPVQKVYGVNTIITKMYSKIEEPLYLLANQGDESFGTRKDVTNLLTELANKIRTIIRESAWEGTEPITFKTAVSKHEIPKNLLAELDDGKWEMIDSWIDHERDHNWNYLNLMEFNLGFNWRNDDHFGLSPQHYRMYAILLTIMKQNKFNDANQINLDDVKNIYKSDQQIPMMIQRMLNKVHIHIQS